MSRPILAEVKPKYKNESPESMIKRFIKKVKKERIIENYLDRKRYEKPSVKRRKERIRRRNVLQKLRKQQNAFIAEQ